MPSVENAPRQVVESWKTLVSRGDNEFVTVNHEVLDNLAANNPDLEIPAWNFAGLYPQNDYAFAVQNIFTNVLNSHFLNRDLEKDGESWTMIDPETGKLISGSDALHIRANQIFGEKEDIKAYEIEALAQPETFDKFLANIPLAEERCRLLGDFALGLRAVYGGSIRELIEASVDKSGDLRLFNNGQGLVERLTSEDFGAAFTDSGTIGDLQFPFNKRANLAGIMHQGRALQSDVLPRVADIEQSGKAPDYRCPQTLRALGAIIYSPALAAAVDNYTPIPHNSQPENEIRAADTYCSDYLLTKVNEIRQDNGQELYNEAHVDFWKWSEGRKLKKQGIASLPHYTVTTAY